MQVVKITISNPNPEMEENATIIVETRRGDNWNRDDSKDIAVGKTEQSSTYQLRRDQRLVIEARTEQELKLDPVQFASIDTKAQRGEEGRADPPQERAEGKNLDQARQRAEAEAKQNNAKGVDSGPGAPQPRTAEVKKDDTNKAIGARDSTSVRDNRPL